MPRRPKPFLYRGWYCTNAGGVPQQKLCKAEEGYKNAETALARLLVQRADAQQAGKLNVPGPGVRPNLPPVLPTQAAGEAYAPGLAGPQSKTVAEVYNDFMDMKKAETTGGTYFWYRDTLDPFFERFATRPIASITYEEGLAYKRWLREEKPWVKGKTKMKGLNATSVNHRVRAAKTLFAWACKPSRRQKYGILVNPWEEIKHLPEKPRERLITDEEFRHLLDQCSDGNVSGGRRDFQEMLSVLRFTTMRPGELRLLQWDYIHWGENRIVFPAPIVKTRRRREVTLIDSVRGIFLARKKRAEERGLKVAGYVFPLPVRGGDKLTAMEAGNRPQQSHSFSQRFRRLFDRCVALGLIEKEKAGERLVLYSSRHTRITELFVQGNTHAEVMFDAGHVIPTTTERYKHLAGSQVAEAIRRRTPTPTASTDGGAG
jgi:integrase